MTPGGIGRFADKVVLVSGAGGGFGRAIARAFLQEGARLLITDRDRSGLDALTAELAGPDGPHGRVGSLAGDVTHLDRAPELDCHKISAPRVSQPVDHRNLPSCLYCVTAEPMVKAD